MDYDGWCKVLERWFVPVEREAAPERPTPHGAWQATGAERIEVWVDGTNHDQVFQADWLVPTPEALGLYSDGRFLVALDWQRIQGLGAAAESPEGTWLPAMRALAATVATMRGQRLQDQYATLVGGLRGIKGHGHDAIAARRVLAKAMARAIVAEHYSLPATDEVEAAVAAVLSLDYRGHCVLPVDDRALLGLLRLLEEGLEPAEAVKHLGLYGEQLHALFERAEQERAEGSTYDAEPDDLW